MRKTKKTFDCLEFKRSAQLSIYEEIKGLSREDQLSYFHRRAETGPLGAWWTGKETSAINNRASSVCTEEGAEYKKKR